MKGVHRLMLISPAIRRSHPHRSIGHPLPVCPEYAAVFPSAVGALNHFFYSSFHRQRQRGSDIQAVTQKSLPGLRCADRRGCSGITVVMNHHLAT